MRFSAAKTNIRSISTFVMKLICAALPIKLSKFLNNIHHTVLVCKN